MNKKELVYTAILTLLIAFMDISGIPSTFFINIQFTDIEPFYFTLMINFLIIGIIATLCHAKSCAKWGVSPFGFPLFIFASADEITHHTVIHYRPENAN